MPIRAVPLINDEVYHIYLRGFDKQAVFSQEEDKVRFLLAILYLQSGQRLGDPTAMSRRFLEEGRFTKRKTVDAAVVSERIVDLMVFCIMPNHFHLIVRQVSDEGLSKYMMRVLNSYAKFYNVKYERTGHVFESEFKSKHISDNVQLLHTSAYIHRNPRELKNQKEEEYRWSSFLDYIQECRWRELLNRSLILDQFDDQKGYKKFVDMSSAKIVD